MGLILRGINYDTGTAFMANDLTRKSWNLHAVNIDFSTIKNELHCTSVNLYGTNNKRLLEAVEIALSQGLNVSVQPRSIDKSKDEMTLNLEFFSAELEKSQRPEKIMLNIGCEASLFTKGFIPGKTFIHRMWNMIWIWPFLSIINKNLSRHLAAVAMEVRQHFSGKLIYGSGSWEVIDWTPFDYIGVNLYRDKENFSSYTDTLKQLSESAKPVIITEFGCCTFKGADTLGGGGWTIVDYKSDPPKLNKIVARDEQCQADLLIELIELYNSHNLYGCFVFDFLEAQQTYSTEPEFDLDRASYGIVRAEKVSSSSIEWKKKLAFDGIAQLYQRLEESD